MVIRVLYCKGPYSVPVHLVCLSLGYNALGLKVLKRVKKEKISALNYNKNDVELGRLEKKENQVNFFWINMDLKKLLSHEIKPKTKGYNY